jgi:hypothetical protein
LLYSEILTVSIFPKYAESAPTGGIGFMAAGSNAVPAGTIGTRESGTCGSRRINSSKERKDFVIVFCRSISQPARVLLICFRKSAIFRLLQASGSNPSSLYSRGKVAGVSELI